MPIMKAVEPFRRRSALSESAFAQLVLWQRPAPPPGCTHLYKYRLDCVIDGLRVLRYDNEAGKGDHRHVRGKENRTAFETVDELLAAFERDIESINHADPDA